VRSREREADGEEGNDEGFEEEREMKENGEFKTSLNSEEFQRDNMSKGMVTSDIINKILHGED
jgi:hypothetical protein